MRELVPGIHLLETSVKRQDKYNHNQSGCFVKTISGCIFVREEGEFTF